MPTDAERRWLDLLSEKATPATAAAYRRRAAAPPPAARYLTPDERAVLNRLLLALIPQSIDHADDLTARVEAARAEGRGDGWRYEVMPPDDVALTRGLNRLDEACRARYGHGFVDATDDERVGLLTDVQAGRVDWPGLPADRWFTELLGQAVELHVSRPHVLAAMGFTGVMFDKGWPAGVGLDAAEPWEPKTP